MMAYSTALSAVLGQVEHGFSGLRCLFGGTEYRKPPEPPIAGCMWQTEHWSPVLGKPSNGPAGARRAPRTPGSFCAWQSELRESTAIPLSSNSGQQNVI